jgi:exopolysaccharide production protein ExoZ
MEGLRGIAMLFVFVGHFGGLWDEMVHPRGSVASFLQLVNADATFGSSLFMLLSAFFVYGSRMRGNKTFREFIHGRMLRLYPLYLILICTYIVGSLVFPKMSRLPAGSGAHTALFILETLLFLPGIFRIPLLMDVAWTLSFVFYFYLVEAALAHIFRRSGLSRLPRFFILITAAILWAFAGEYGLWERRTAILWTGMALWEAVDAMSGELRAWAVRLTTPAAIIAILGVLARTNLMLYKPTTGIVPLLVYRAGITSVTLSAFVWVVYFGPQWWKDLLSGPRLRRMGTASYSFYLTHGFALKVFKFGVIPILGPLAAAPIVFWICQITGLALSIAIARGVHLLIENPLSQLTQEKFRSFAVGNREPAVSV